MKKSTITEFESKFTKGEGCWIWNAAVKDRKWNYGSLKYQGLAWRAHRLSYHLYKGPIPKGMSVLHSCDNPICVNPDHLWIGTKADNNLDRAKKFRSSNKLNKQQVVFIRQSGMNQNDLAKFFGICQQTVSDIIHRKHYKHIIDT